MFRSRLWKLGRWAVSGALIGTAAVATGVVYSATAYPPPSGNTYDPKWDYNWDKREPYSLIKPPKQSKSRTKRDANNNETEEEEKLADQLEKKKSKACRHLILIRHGQYKMDGDSDCDHMLTPLGREQAAATGKRLKQLALNIGFEFCSIISSDMCRAKETADIIAKNIGQKDLCVETRDPMLAEGAPIAPDPPTSSNWHPHLHQFYSDGARIEAAFRKYFHRAEPEQEKDSYEVIVCHANVIRYFVCRAMQFPPEAWLRISLQNASLTMLTITPSGRVILRSVSDTGHMEPKMLTTS